MLVYSDGMICFALFFFFQAEDGIRDLVRSRGLGDVYKRQSLEKALYEVRYELNNRPAWIDIPIGGLLELATGDMNASA